MADTKAWDGNNEKTMGTITLCCFAPIRTQVAVKINTKEIWDLLKESYVMEGEAQCTGTMRKGGKL